MIYIFVRKTIMYVVMVRTHKGPSGWITRNTKGRFKDYCMWQHIHMTCCGQQ